MDKTEKAILHLNESMSDWEQRTPLPFREFLETFTDNPFSVVRNVFQIFHDMVKAYVTQGLDEYPDDPESINFIDYDCSKLFVEDSGRPFFADRLFANRLIGLVESLKRGAQQNKIYIFEGPPGCGKSTFLNNLLKRFEEYANTEDGSRFEVLWKFDRETLGNPSEYDHQPFFEKLSQLLDHTARDSGELLKEQSLPHPPHTTSTHIEVPCPSHDHPLLMIPKPYRREFFDDLLINDEFKWKLFTNKEYEWVFRDNPCTICSSLFGAFLNKLGSPHKVFEMLYARPYQFNRRLGEGITVFNPGDKPTRQNLQSNAMLQRRINSLLMDSNQVKYIFSRYARTNNGIYALMDVKSHNKERLIELHNIISEGLHKVEDIEENVKSLLLAVMNPEDKENIKGFQSFSDRIEYISIPYVMDLKTEVAIYVNTFGKHIYGSFLPRVLHNFARVILSTRLNTTSEALLEWIGNPDKYQLYCDKNLQLLKMEIYTGHIPTWLSEEDRKRLTAKRRRKIIAESEQEGDQGISGRDSIKIFNEFYSTYAKEDKLITMSTLCHFFTKIRKELTEAIPEGFLDSLVRMYDYTVLQEVKESLYYYNEDQISREIQNYLFAVNFEVGSVETCTYTEDRLEITDEFLENIEDHLLGTRTKVSKNQRLAFRQATQKEYTAKALTQEIMVEGRDITETDIFKSMHERYGHNLKEKVLDPFLENENFRRAIKDCDEEDFKTYDKKIKNDVTYLMENLCNKYGYTKQGAKEVCIYVIDNDLPTRLADS